MHRGEPRCVLEFSRGKGQVVCAVMDLFDDVNDRLQSLIDLLPEGPMGETGKQCLEDSSACVLLLHNTFWMRKDSV